MTDKKGPDVPLTDVKKEMEKKKPDTPQPPGPPKRRLIVIEIAKKDIIVLQNDCASPFELMGILDTLLKGIRK